MKYSEILKARREEAAQDALAKARAQAELAELAERPLGSGLVPVFLIAKDMALEWVECLLNVDIGDIPEMSLTDIRNACASLIIPGPEITLDMGTWTWSHMSSSGRVWALVYSGQYCWTSTIQVRSELGPCLELNLSESLGGLVTAGLSKCDKRSAHLFRHLILPLQEKLGFPGLIEQVDRLLEATGVL